MFISAQSVHLNNKSLQTVYVSGSCLKQAVSKTDVAQSNVDVCLEMFGCLQAERTIAIQKRKFLNKFSIIHCAGYSLLLLRQNLNHVHRRLVKY